MALTLLQIVLTLVLLHLKKSFGLPPIKYMPFSFFSTRYLKLLKPFDLVVANSKVTATFLHSLYNVDVSGIVYPSIDTDNFPARRKKTWTRSHSFIWVHI